MEGLVQALYLAALQLDGLAYTAPRVPNAGASTPVIADAVASVSRSFGQFTTALVVTVESVEASIDDTVATDDVERRRIDGLGP